MRAGLEFIAARKALIELLKQQQQQQAAAGGTAADGDDDSAAAAAAAASGGQPAQQQQQPTWLQMCVAADRPVMSTLTGLWGALGPWKRLELLCGVAWMLLWKVRGQGLGLGLVRFRAYADCWAVAATGRLSWIAGLTVMAKPYSHESNKRSCCWRVCPCVVLLQFDESLIASLANEDLVDSLLAELQEDYPQLLKPLLHDRCAGGGGDRRRGRMRHACM